MRVLFEQRFRREIRGGEFQFSFAYSGEEALTFLRDHPSEVVLILSDINMPGMRLAGATSKPTPYPPRRPA